MTTDLGSFLRARREAASPDSLPFVSSSVRRVPGLRRDEVAMLAGMSVDYYTRLEQGREGNPSPQVLAALARALDLTPAQTGYLHALCDLLWHDPEREAAAPVDSTLLRMMDSWTGSAAFVLDPLLEVVATNALADALFSPFTVTRNLAEMVFLDVGGRSFYVDWDRAALSCVGALRRNTSFVADVVRREELISRLNGGSVEFEELWARHEVEAKTQDHKVLRHPVAGEITIDFHTFGVTSLPGSELVVYQAEPGSESEQRMRGLVDADIPELAS